MNGKHTDPVFVLGMHLPGNAHVPVSERLTKAAEFIATEAGSAAAALWRIDGETDGLTTAWQEANRKELGL